MCYDFQFDSVLKAPNGREKLPRFMDPKLRDDYPIDAAWKVGFPPLTVDSAVSDFWTLSFQVHFTFYIQYIQFYQFFARSSNFIETGFQMAQLAGSCTQELRSKRPTMRKAVVALMTLSSTTQDWELGASGKTVAPRQLGC